MKPIKFVAWIITIICLSLGVIAATRLSGGLRHNTDTTGTNTIEAAVTVGPVSTNAATATNLYTGTITVTNRTTMSGPVIITSSTLSYSGTNLTVDAATSSRFRAQLTQNTGLSLTGGTDGQDLTVSLMQDSTGNRLLTVTGTNVIYGTDLTGVTLTTNALYWDHLKFTVVGGTYHLVGFVRGYNAPAALP